MTGRISDDILNHVLLLNIQFKGIVTRASSEQKLSQKNTKTFVRISQTFRFILAKINKAKKYKNDDKIRTYIFYAKIFAKKNLAKKIPRKPNA